MGHYSPVWVPGAISIIDEPQGAFTFWSSTPAVLADSGPLHGLLITVSWAINHHFRFPERFSPLTNPRCIYVLVINTRSFGRFGPLRGLLITVSWAINHHFGFLERFPSLTNPRVHLRPGHQHPQFWPILAHYMDY